MESFSLQSNLGDLSHRLSEYNTKNYDVILGRVIN